VANRKRKRKPRPPAPTGGSASAPVDPEATVAPGDTATSASPSAEAHHRLDEEIGLSPRKPGPVNAALVVGVVILLALATVALLLLTHA
jgi:hypothetical protein